MCLLTYSETPCDHCECKEVSCRFSFEQAPSVSSPTALLNSALMQMNQVLGQVVQQNCALAKYLEAFVQHIEGGSKKSHLDGPEAGQTLFLELVEEVPTLAYKEKGFGLTCRMMRGSGIPYQFSGLRFKLRLYTQDSPPTRINMNIAGKKVLRGTTEAVSTAEGIISFPNIVINEVSSHYLNNAFCLMVVQVEETKVSTFTIPSLTVKARKQVKSEYKTSIADIDELAVQ